MSLDVNPAAIGHRILTQDNRATAHPLFLVQQEFRVYGVDDDYTDKVEWVCADDLHEVEPALAASLELGHRHGVEVPFGYRRVGYTVIWEFVTACFTEEAADLYIANNRHNLREPRTYAATLYRNPEMIAIREHLKDAAKGIE